jgi:hypothetical protein
LAVTKIHGCEWCAAGACWLVTGDS